mgnify:CR=1 FL=1
MPNHAPCASRRRNGRESPLWPLLSSGLSTSPTGTRKDWCVARRRSAPSALGRAHTACPTLSSRAPTISLASSGPQPSGADVYAGCGRTEYRRHDQGGHRRSDRHVCGATHLCAHCQNLSAHHGPLAASRCKGRKDGLAAPRSCRIVHGSRQSSYASPTYRWVLRMIWIF